MTSKCGIFSYQQIHSFNDEQWDKILEAFYRMLKLDEVKKIIQPEYECGWSWYSTHEDLGIHKTAIAFNGKDDIGAGETFLIQKTLSQEEKPDQCNTHNEPYGMAVAAMLIACLFYAPSRMKVKANGDGAVWAEGCQIFNQVSEKPCVIQVYPSGFVGLLSMEKMF